jgi:hypothetical protein
MNTATMNHPTVCRDPHLYVVATVDVATFASWERTLQRRGTILLCGRLVSYFDRANLSVASFVRGEDEYGQAPLASAKWQARIDARQASGGIDLAAEDAAALAV